MAAKSHPKKYVARITRQRTRWKYGFATQSTTIASILVQMNNELKALARRANVALIFGDNNTGAADQLTKPIQEADRISAQDPAVFGSFNIFDSIMQRVLAPFKEECIPVIQIQGQAKGTVFLGTDNRYSAGLGGKYLAQVAKARGWAPNTVTVLMVTQPNLPPNLQQLWLSCGREAQRGLSGSKLESIEVPVQDLTAGAQTTMTNWLTSHPNEHHVLVCPPSDLFAIGIANAFTNSGRAADGAVIGNLATKEARAILKGAPSPLVGSVDAGFQHLGAYSLGMAMDIRAGRPVPLAVYPGAHVVTRRNA